MSVEKFTIAIANGMSIVVTVPALQQAFQIAQKANLNRDEVENWKDNKSISKINAEPLWQFPA